MSYIQIDKKAVTEEEARAFLNQSYSLEKPLGTTTLFIRPEDFPSQSEAGKQSVLFKAINNLKRIFKTKTATEGALSKKLAPFKYLDIDNEFNELQKIALRSIEQAQKSTDDVFDHAIHNLSVPKFAQSAEEQVQDTYMQPFFSVVFPPDKDLKFAEMLAMSELNFMTETPSQFPFTVLWHEIAHGAGASEPQADMIAATVTRQAFENNHMISGIADVRAFHAVVYSSNKKGYGWPMVEANDYVMSLPEETIDTMSEQEIKDIRFQKFDHLAETVSEVNRLLKKQVGLAFYDPNLLGLAEAAQKLRKDINLSLTDNHKQILTRFELATRRLHRGAVAYDKRYDLVPNELLQSERAEPITFTPSEGAPSAE